MLLSAHNTDRSFQIAGRLKRMLLLVFIGAVLTGCTENPFESETPLRASPRRITGTVSLGDRDDHSGVYIWLEGFGIATSSSANGDFVLTLPPAAAQSPNGGVTGMFRLYAFLGNYRSVMLTTVVKNGVFSLPTEAIDEQGHVRERMYMQQRFSVNSILSHTSIPADSPRTITMSVELQAASGGVSVYFPRRVGDTEGPVIIQNIATGEARVWPGIVTGIELSDYITLGSAPYRRSMILIIPRGTLKAGRYRILPYILPGQLRLPASLLDNLGEGVTEVHPGYARYPMLREGGELSVTPY
jgi:hypothetical protein